MSQFFELLISGLMLGCIYALLAMGFVIVFKATNVVNFAHASVVMLGAFLVAKWHGSLGFFGAIGVSVVVCALLAVALDIAFLRPLRRRVRGVDALAIMTIALNILLGTALVRAVGNDLLPSGAPWGANTTHVFGAAIPQARIGAAVVALVLIGIFYVVFTRSTWGVAMRAAASDPEAAALMGIRLGPGAGGSWAVGGGRGGEGGGRRIVGRGGRAGGDRRGLLRELPGRRREQRDRPAGPQRDPGGRARRSGLDCRSDRRGAYDRRRAGARGRLPGQPVVPRPRAVKRHPVRGAVRRAPVAAVRAVRDEGADPCLRPASGGSR